MQFPDLVALSIDLTRGNCSSVWSMNHLETLEISLIEPGSPPQPTWKLPALRSLSVMTALCMEIEGLEPFFDVHGPHIHSLAISSSKYGASEIPGTWWPLLPHLDTLHLGYNIRLYPSNPPIAIRHIHLHSLLSLQKLATGMENRSLVRLPPLQWPSHRTYHQTIINYMAGGSCR